MTTHQHPEHDRVRDLLGLYAMDATEPADAHAVERHVARCESCHAELQSLLATADTLAFVSQQQLMPAHLHASILTAVNDTMATATLSPASPARKSRSAGRRRPRFSQFRHVALPAAACVAIAFGAAIVQTSRLADSNRQLDSLRGTRIVQPANQSIVGASHTVEVDTSGALDGSTMELVDVHGAGLLVTKNLPEPPTGYEWRVWGVDKSHNMHPMGGLNAKPEDGMSLQPIRGLHDLPLDAIAITLEQNTAGGVQSGPVVGWAKMA